MKSSLDVNADRREDYTGNLAIENTPRMRHAHAAQTYDADPHFFHGCIYSTLEKAWPFTLRAFNGIFRP
jgi:hypothetical protein